MKLNELIAEIEKQADRCNFIQMHTDDFFALIGVIKKMREALEYYAKPVMHFDGHASIGQSRSVLKTRHSMTKAREVLKELG